MDQERSFQKHPADRNRDSLHGQGGERSHTAQELPGFEHVRFQVDIV